MSGDMICPECGGYFCQRDICKFKGMCERLVMSLRSKDDAKRFEPEDFVLPNPFDPVDRTVANNPVTLGQTFTLTIGGERYDETAQLEAYLTQYLGDPVFAKRFTECISMLRSKNKDYSQGEQQGDRIAAFRRIARDINITMRQAWAVFCQKHWGAVMKFVKDGTVESEPIDGRINDIINYMVLLGAIIDDERTSKK